MAALTAITVRLTPRRDPIALFRLWRARRMVRRVDRVDGWSKVKCDRDGIPVGEFRPDAGALTKEATR